MLPFLVVHGAIVWKLLLAALVALGLGVLRGLRRWSTRRAEFRTLARLHGTIGPLQDGMVVIRGIVRGGTFATLGGNGRQFDRAIGVPWIDCDGVRVELDVAPRVLIGARTRSSAFRESMHLDPVFVGLGDSPLTLREVRDGDPVIVAGTAFARLGAAMARETPVTWQLVGSPIEVVAAAPQIATPARHPIATAAIGSLIALICYGGLHHVGSIAAAAAGDTRPRATMTEIDPFGPIAIAAAMPGSRKDAFQAISNHLERDFTRGPARIALEDELADRKGGCAKASNQFDEVRLEEALESARRCGDRGLEVSSLIFLGRFEQAWALQPLADERILVAIATGRWSDAAVTLEAFAKDLPTPEREDLGCLATWFHHLAHEPSGSVTSSSLTCAVTAALMKPEPEQPAALSAIALPDGFDDWRMADHVRALVALSGSVDQRLGFDLEFDGTLSADAWLAPFGVPTPTTMRGRASVATVRGRFDEADRILDAIDEPHRWLTRRIAEFEGRIISPTPEDDPYFDRVNGSGVYPPSCGPEFVAAIARARTGDGGPLATVLRECDAFETENPTILRALPYLTSHQAELVPLLRWRRGRITTYRLDYVPFHYLDDAMMNRDLARLVGDAAEGARWQAIIDRHAAVLADRDRVIALLLWTER